MPVLPCACESAAHAESYGFDIYHLAEHHGTPLGLVPSPSVFLAAAAVRTSRIRLCPLVYVLPLYHPARLAEEIAMLDQLSAAGHRDRRRGSADTTLRDHAQYICG